MTVEKIFQGLVCAFTLTALSGLFAPVAQAAEEKTEKKIDLGIGLVRMMLRFYDAGKVLNSMDRFAARIEKAPQTKKDIDGLKSQLSVLFDAAAVRKGMGRIDACLTDDGVMDKTEFLNAVIKLGAAEKTPIDEKFVETARAILKKHGIADSNDVKARHLTQGAQWALNQAAP